MNYLIALLLFSAVPSVSYATPAQVLIIRHAEKPDSGKNLSPEGYAHAQKLVNYFTTNSQVLKFGLPVAIYAMASGDEDASNRPIETVTPLANALHLKLQTGYQKLEQTELAQAILNNPAYDGKMVLICWEHKAIRDMVSAFGVEEDPGKWPKSDFTTVYEIDFSTSGQVKTFSTFEQDL